MEEQLERISLLAAVESGLGAAREEAGDVSISLYTDIARNVLVWARHEPLAAAVQSLIMYVLNWGRPPFVVRVLYISDGAEVHVEDGGTPLPLDDRDIAVSSGALADSRRVMERFGGTVFLGESTDRGMSVRLRIPRHR